MCLSIIPRFVPGASSSTNPKRAKGTEQICLESGWCRLHGGAATFIDTYHESRHRIRPQACLSRGTPSLLNIVYRSSDAGPILNPWTLNPLPWYLGCPYLSLAGPRSSGRSRSGGIAGRGQQATPTAGRTPSATRQALEARCRRRVPGGHACATWCIFCNGSPRAAPLPVGAPGLNSRLNSRGAPAPHAHARPRPRGTRGRAPGFARMLRVGVRL